MTEPASELSLGRILVFTRRWLAVILLSTLLVGGLGATVTFLWPRSYASHFSVFVTGANSIAASAKVQAELSALFGLSSGGNEYVTSVLKSDRIKLAVIEALGLMENDDFWFACMDERTPKYALRQLGKHMDLEAPAPPLLGPVRLTIVTVDAELSNKIANQFLYLLDKRTERESKGRAVFLEEQLKESREALEKAEVALQVYAETEDIVVPLEELGKEEFMAQVTLKTQKILGEVELKALRARLGAPGDITVQMQLQSEIAGLEAKLGQLDETLLSREAMFDSLPARAKGYADRMRDLKTREKIFEIYLEHYELARLYEIGGSETRFYRTIDTPYLAVTPVKRYGLLKVLASLFLGGLMGLALALFVEGLELAKKEEQLLKAAAEGEVPGEAS